MQGAVFAVRVYRCQFMAHVITGLSQHPTDYCWMVRGYPHTLTQPKAKRYKCPGQYDTNRLILVLAKTYNPENCHHKINHV